MCYVFISPIQKQKRKPLIRESAAKNGSRFMYHGFISPIQKQKA